MAARVKCIPEGRGATLRVETHAGYVIGWVRPQSRIAAGTKGERRRFFAACPWIPSGRQGEGSIGTRFPTPQAAAKALAEFHASYPPARIEAIAAAIPEDRMHSIYLLTRHGWAAKLYSACLTAQLRFRTERYNDHRPKFGGPRGL